MSSSSINIYDFPSSMMSLSAYFNNKIYVTFLESEIKEIKDYYYNNNLIFKNYKDLKDNKNYTIDKKQFYNFFSKNLSIEEESSAKRIYEYIIKNI